MTEAEKAEFREYIFTAVQAGKKETSELVDTIMHKLEPAVATNIEKYVNGNIRHVREHLEKQDQKLEDIHSEQTRVAGELTEFKKRTEPLIESRMTVLNVGRFVIWIGAISGATAAIIWLVDKLKILK